MKNTLRKRTFISAIAMLLVSAIVLTSSTFAWFTMAREVQVENMELNITSPDGVQLSANTKAFTTSLTQADFVDPNATTRWKAYDGNTNNFPELLRPSSSSLNVSKSLPVFFEGAVDEDRLLTVKKVASDVGSGYVAFDLFVKVGKNETVWWNSSTVTCEDNPDVEKAMRLGIVNCGLVAERAEADVINTVLPASTANNTVVMYEMNSQGHTVDSGYEDGASVPNKYIIAETTDTLMEGPNKNYITPGNLTTTIYHTVNETNVATRGYFNATAGVNRIRVYLWMEGNDVDCANDVAGATIDFNLVLTLDNKMG